MARGSGGDRRRADRPAMRRVFLLSPANASGLRAAMLVRPAAQFDLAVELRSERGAPLGDVFQFMSGLYFRGKLAYARAFARPPRGVGGALVIVPGRGLVSADERVRAADLAAFAAVPIDSRDERYTGPLREAADRVASLLGPTGEAVLLGSIATGKYADVLLAALGARLSFPPAFVGRGDMSRGGLMLRSVRAGMELEYAPVAGAVRHGPRPPRLPRLPRLT
ncbi:MAG TPA: hypothetical protein VFK85_07375 [Anaeromyxobacteraceae bacterium]|nr:hypothetical protein [Anaeromyxobacteraceae bacterium]